MVHPSDPTKITAAEIRAYLNRTEWTGVSPVADTMAPHVSGKARTKFMSRVRAVHNRDKPKGTATPPEGRPVSTSSRFAIRVKGGKQEAVHAYSADADEFLGTLEHGTRVHGFNLGQFSMIDLLRAVVAQTGPAKVTLSTWTAGIKDIELAAWMLYSGAITGLRFFVDRSFPGRQPAYCRKLLEAFGPNAITCYRTHAKFFVVENDEWSVV